MNPKVVEEQPINIYELKTEIARIKKRDEEPSIRVGKVEEYINTFAVLKQTDAKKLEKELTDLEIPRLKDYHIKKIIDILPASVEELKVILQGYTLTVNKDNMVQIVDAIKPYLPKE